MKTITITREESLALQKNPKFAAILEFWQGDFESAFMEYLDIVFPDNHGQVCSADDEF